VQLSLQLSAAEANIYCIFGSDSLPMTFPAAYNSGLGGDVGVSPVIAPEDAYDSWLTVGDVSGDAISSMGVDFAAWSTDSLTGKWLPAPMKTAPHHSCAAGCGSALWLRLNYSNACWATCVSDPDPEWRAMLTTVEAMN
jgi:hypothetical protein